MAGALALSLVSPLLIVACQPGAVSTPVTTAQASGPSCGGGLFTAPPGPPARPLPPSRAIRRWRPVGVDVGRITGPPDASGRRPGAARLTLDLFDDTCLTAVRESATWTPPAHLAWTGRVDGEPPGRVTLIVDGALVVGLVALPRAVYEIRYLGDGVHAIVEVDQGAFGPD